MIEILQEFMQNDIIETRYRDTMKYEPYIKNLKIYQQYSLNDVLTLLKDNISDIIYEMNDINLNILYNSYLHGVNHNRRVLFFAYAISFFENLDRNDLRIVLDGCKYHDIGRIDDMIDDDHGRRSAEMIRPHLNYKDSNYSLAIIEMHSINDKYMESVLNKYNVDKKRFIKLNKILKDADALDRVRLDNNDEYCWLDPKYLRHEKSHQLVYTTKELNSLF